MLLPAPGPRVRHRALMLFCLLLEIPRLGLQGLKGAQRRGSKAAVGRGLLHECFLVARDVRGRVL
jgi:hypothetical protein